LTLTGADTVIHYDPWWNPAVENQATDRAYRIGQDNPVFVHKLICQNTVEERIQQMQEKKDDLAGDLLSGATSQLNLTTESMALLLGAPQDP
jgi:SNF2 family DNA or RNA helicase